MNRDIKFRAWYNDGDRKEMIAFGVFDTDEGYHISQIVYIAECPLMQFTGLKDKNGIDIYEGDIVRLNEQNNRYRIVVWDNGAYHFRVHEWEANKSMPTYPLYFAAISHEANGEPMPEIMGNIYENPELLK